jgi:aminopeptidase N
MRRGFAGDIAANPALPVYHLNIRIDPAAGTLSGSERIDFPNRTGMPLDDVALRLYPNFPRDVFGKGGDVRMDVTSAAINGQTVSFEYAAQRTAVLLPFVPALAPGQTTTVAISFTATLVPWRDGTWPLPSYYPMLAVRDGDRWRLDVTHFADHVYAESALYAADIRVPAGFQVVASGSTSATQAHDDGSTTYTIVSGPIREFALTLGDFATARATAGDVAINVYTARSSRLDARQIANVAARALADFDRRFGQYPYRELDIHLLPYEYDGGDEYPGLILLYSAGQVGAGTRYVAAHEVAHQWWYALVGNDIYGQPWLDEAFAQYSGIIYDEDVAGAAVATSDWEREVLRRYHGALDDGDLPIGLPIHAYPSFNVYYRTIYGKGSVFLRKLRDELGDEVFFKALQIYYQRHRYGVATTEDVRQAFEAASGQALGPLFQEWVGGK